MIEDIFAKVADYHLDHRGHIGFVAGAVAAFLFARSGADVTIAGLFFELVFGNDNPAVDQLKFVTGMTGVPSLLLVAGGVVADVVIHKNRTDEKKKINEEQISRDVNDRQGPQPPAP